MVFSFWKSTLFLKRKDVRKLGKVIHVPRVTDNEGVVNVDISIEKHQFGHANVKTEIQRIIAYFLSYPDSKMYVWGKRGAIKCWTTANCCTVWEYYNRVLSPALKTKNLSFSVLGRAKSCPVWSVNDEVISYMETAGMLDVSSDRMTAKPTKWLFEVGERGSSD